MCEIASRTSDPVIMDFLMGCIDYFRGSIPDTPDSTLSQNCDFPYDFLVDTVIRPVFNEAAATAAATAATELQAVQDAAAMAAEKAQQAQDDADAAQATLALAAQVCPEVQSADGVYSVGPVDCDRIHSVYQNNQCCGTC